MDENIRHIGNELVSGSQDVFSARSVMDELFPFIYVASRRMSTRAISRWLKEVHNITISHVSIAKALKESEERIREKAKEVSQWANEFVEIHPEYELARVILDSQCVQEVEAGRYSAANGSGMPAREYASYHLENDWHDLPSGFKEECIRYLGSMAKETDAESKRKPKKGKKK